MVQESFIRSTLEDALKSISYSVSVSVLVAIGYCLTGASSLSQLSDVLLGGSQFYSSARTGIFFDDGVGPLERVPAPTSSEWPSMRSLGTRRSPRKFPRQVIASESIGIVVVLPTAPGAPTPLPEHCARGSEPIYEPARVIPPSYPPSCRHCPVSTCLCCQYLNYEYIYSLSRPKTGIPPTRYQATRTCRFHHGVV